MWGGGRCGDKRARGGASKGHRVQASPREFKRQSAGTRKLKPKRSACPFKAALPCALVPCVARPHTRARVSTPARHLSVADASSACCLSLTPFPLAGLRCADDQRSRANQAQQGVLAATMIILHRGLNFFLRCAPPGPTALPTATCPCASARTAPPCQHALLPVLHSGARFPAGTPRYLARDLRLNRHACMQRRTDRVLLASHLQMPRLRRPDTSRRG